MVRGAIHPPAPVPPARSAVAGCRAVALRSRPMVSLTPAAAPARERILTWPLALFLLGVAAVLGYGAWQRFRTPDAETAIHWLGDGDLDGDERARALQALLANGVASPSPRHRWAALLAAVALRDRKGYDACLAALGGGEAPAAALPEDQRALLHLGDPLLGNCLRALLADAAHDRAAATAAWQVVQTESRLADQPFALALAEAALRRR